MKAIDIRVPFFNINISPLFELIWHKARSIEHPVRIELISNGLLAQLTNYYTTQGTLDNHNINNGKTRIRLSGNFPWIRGGWLKIIDYNCFNVQT